MRRILAAIMLFGAARSIPAAERDLTPLQAPRSTPVPCAPVAFEQPSRLAVWQYYAVDRHGNFRPRVPLIPDQFSPATVQPRYYLPYIMN